MATDPGFVEYVVGQAGLAEALTWRRMFGEYGFYLDGRFVAIAADDMLFLKVTEAGRALLPGVGEGRPYPGAKPWFLVDEALDDPDLFRKLLRATAAALPPVAPKAKRAGRGTPVGGGRGRRVR